MKGKAPYTGSGKTLFNRIKRAGESWINARDQAVEDGRWSMPKMSTKASIVK